MAFFYFFFCIMKFRTMYTLLNKTFRFFFIKIININYSFFIFNLFKITMKMIALIIIHETFELSIIMSSLFHRFLLW